MKLEHRACHVRRSTQSSRPLGAQIRVLSGTRKLSSTRSDAWFCQTARFSVLFKAREFGHNTGEISRNGCYTPRDHEAHPHAPERAPAFHEFAFLKSCASFSPWIIGHLKQNRRGALGRFAVSQGRRRYRMCAERQVAAVVLALPANHWALP